MNTEVRTIVTFESTAFNLSEPKDYFINPCCFGDDLAKWLIGELCKLGVKTDQKPGQEDFGWYLCFEIEGAGHCFVIGRRPTGEREKGRWIGWLERSRGLIGSIMGRRKRGIRPSAAEAIHKILTSSGIVRDLRWHLPSDFKRGIEDRGALSPQAP